MTPPPPLSPDLLLAHASSLRALAFSLLRDAHAAEDALQETFARALERPPASLERLGAWLRVVLESVARKRMRGELRRARREHDNARHDLVPAVDEGIARSEVLRAVLDAVLALDEPYREVVLDRYFEGRTPREIANRRGLSVHTVTSRLGRARGRLRERLARELGAGDERWRRTLSAVFGLALPSSRNAPLAIGVIPGVLALSLKLKLAVFATIAALAGLGWFMRGADVVEPDAAPTEVGALAPELELAARGPARGAALAAGGETQRELVAPPAADDGPEEHALPPYRFPLVIEVRDGDDRPLANARIDVAPPAGHWNPAGVTDAHGRLALTLRGFQPTLRLALRARPPFGQRGTTRALELAAGATTGVALGLPDAGLMHIQFTMSADDASGEYMTIPALNRAAMNPGLVSRELGRYPDGSVAFSASPLGAPAEPDPDSVVLGNISSVVFAGPETGFSELAGENLTGRVSIVLSGAPSAAAAPDGTEPGAHATGVLENADGNALAGVRIEARDASGALVTESWTDEEGAYELGLTPTGELTLRAGGGERGIARTTWDPTVEPELRWNPRLERGHELLGLLLDEHGEPLAGWEVEVRLDDADAPWWDETRTGEDGRFAIPNLPRRPLQLALRSPDATNALAQAWLDDVWPGYDERTFELGADALRTGSVHAQVVDGDGAPLAGCELRLWQECSGFEARLDSSKPAGGYDASGLPAGAYRLEVVSAEHGSTSASSFHLAPGEELDLGVLRLAAPGTLALSFPELDPADSTAVELWLLHADHEACVVRSEHLPTDELRLAPGRYELIVTVGERRAVRAITLAAGERLELGLEELAAPVVTRE